MRWSLRRRSPVIAPEAATKSIADPELLVLFGGQPLDNIVVGEHSVLSASPFFRGIMLISGTLAGLPLNTYSSDKDGQPKKVNSIFDDPDGPDGQTVFEWKQTAFIHRILHGSAFALKVRNAAGKLVRLPLLHPLCVQVELPTADDYANKNLPLGGKWFRVTFNDNSQKILDANDVWEIPSASLDGVYGLGLLKLARQSIATTLAGEKGTYKLFSKGALISGMATPADEYDITDELPALRREVNREMLGADNAGGIAIVNRRLNFTPWTMTAVDAQLLQSRQFQIEEAARWLGIPPHLLMQTEKQTSWGTGVDEQNRGLSKFVLNQWALSFEQRASRLLPDSRWTEFDFAGLEHPSFEKEVELLMKQTGGKPILTVNEARAIRNLPPVPGGDVLLDGGTSNDPNAK